MHTATGIGLYQEYRTVWVHVVQISCSLHCSFAFALSRYIVHVRSFWLMERYFKPSLERQSDSHAAHRATPSNTQCIRLLQMNSFCWPHQFWKPSYATDYTCVHACMTETKDRKSRPFLRSRRPLFSPCLCA